MDLELAGRRVLVTRAATGIGRSTVQTLAAENPVVLQRRPLLSTSASPWPPWNTN